MTWLNDERFSTMRRGFRGTVVAGAFCQAIAIALFAAANVDAWRLSCLAIAFIAFAVIEHRIMVATDGDGAKDAACARIVWVAQLAQVASMTVTGGLASPYLVAALVPALMPLVLFGPVSQSRASMLLAIVPFVMVAVLPESVTGPPLPRASFIGVALAAYASTLFLVQGAMQRVAAAAKTSGQAIERLHDRRLSMIEKRARTLRSFRAKLADELRNPISVIKALVQLVVRSPSQERNQERLRVLEGEVMRIERIVDDYLSFRRPIEALDVQEVDVAAIAAEAASTVVHRASDSAIRLDLMLRTAVVRGDLDKLADSVLELLTKVLANAPRGSVLMVATYPGEDGAGVIKVRSSHPREPRELALNATFAALVVAQHGGELTCDRDGEHGVAVTIVLPGDPKADRDAVFFLD